MSLTLVANVGDGLCMAARTNIGEAMLIDCGSTAGRWNLSGSEYAFNGLCRIISLLSTPRTMFISHIHVDHYNGLIYADRQGSSHLLSAQNIREIIDNLDDSQIELLYNEIKKSRT